MKGSWHVGRIDGIEIGIHYTWLLALFIFTWLVGQGFTVTYPGWHSCIYWIAGFLATFTLFISVLIHELAHSLVARALESLRTTRLDGKKENRAMPDTRYGNKRKNVKGECAYQFRLDRF